MAPVGSGIRRLLAALTALCLPGAAAFGEAQKYLIIASPSASRISYLKLPESGAPATGGEGVRTLIDSGSGLTFPQGVAVDEYRRMLYVADPALGRLVGYSLDNRRSMLGFGTPSDELSVGSQQTIAENVEVRAVAVDGLGNVFMTDEATQRVLMVTADQISRGQTTPTVLYDNSDTSAVREPGGIATDNYFVYWLNKADGETAGSLIRASARGLANSSLASAGGPPLQLASNTPKSYGVCLALGNVYYTDEFNFYGVPRAATARDEYVTVSTAMQEPRGCAFDGHGTVYVADKNANAVYQFPSNRLQQASLVQAATMEGAYGLAMYTRVTA